MKKRLTSLLLAVILCLGLLPAAAMAADETPFGTYGNGSVNVAIPAGTLSENTQYGTIAVKTADGATLVGMGSSTSEANGSLTMNIWTGSKANIGDKTHYVFVYKNEDGSLVAKGPITAEATVIPVTGVTLNKTTLSLTVGGNETLTATVAPSDATNKSVTWSSSNTAVATVDAYGKVTAEAAGNATITVTTADGGKTASCTVTVTSGSRPGPSSGGGGGGSSASYAITVKNPSNGDVTSNRTSASSGTTVTLTVDPDEGYKLDELVVTDKNGKEIKLTSKGNGKYSFTMPASKVTVEASFARIQEISPVNPFTDVAPGSYYYDAVLWAVENGITAGTGDGTTFSPGASCTRAQTVTFLWRAAGSPAVSGANPFTDVVPGSYYYDAVLWAVQNGITNGTSATTFSPDDVVTRGQNVTFLWRWAKSPAAYQANPFTDVTSDAYYYDAVLWAAEEGVTAGTSATTFSPNDPCLRSQIVAFLYRFMGD